MKEIKRNNWAKFCRNFNSSNQYRQLDISIVEKNNNSRTLAENLPFLGISLEKTGRSISGLQIFTGLWDPEKILSPILTIKEPSSVFLQKDSDNSDKILAIESKDGSRAELVLFGAPNPDQSRLLVEKLAYALAERRGFSGGNDMSDWLEAERLVHQAEMRLKE